MGAAEASARPTLALTRVEAHSEAFEEAGMRLTTLGIVATAALAAAAPAARGVEKQIIVTVTDTRTNAPVTDLPAQLFAIREDNLDREIVSVARATEPLQVILLADTTTAFTRFVQDLRLATREFTHALLEASPESSVALWEFGGADIPVVNFTSDLSALDDGTTKLFPKGTSSNIPASERLPTGAGGVPPGTGATATQILGGSRYSGGGDVTASNLLEAVVGASKQLARRPGMRRVIVSFNADVSVEASSVQGPAIQDEVRKAGVSWFGLSLNEKVNNGPLRDNVMNVLCPLSGGQRFTVVDIAALAPSLRNIARILTSQYVLTYKRPIGEPTQVVVGIRREGLRAATFRWAPR
jgi:hypothetical protein